MTETKDERCPECDHSAGASFMGGICIGCPCESGWHSDVSQLQRKLDEKYVPQAQGGTFAQEETE